MKSKVVRYELRSDEVKVPIFRTPLPSEETASVIVREVLAKFFFSIKLKESGTSVMSWFVIFPAISTHSDIFAGRAVQLLLKRASIRNHLLL